MRETLDHERYDKVRDALDLPDLVDVSDDDIEV
jgi:hypothetical protein